MPFDKQAWLDEMTEGLPKDQQAQVKAEMGKLLADEALAKNIAGSHSRQSDYSRNMDEMKKAQAQRDQQIQTLQREYDYKHRRLTDWHASAEKIIAEKDKLAAAATAARARIEGAFAKVAEEAGVDPKQYLDGYTPSAPGAAPAAPAIDTSQFVRRDEYDKRIANITKSATRWPILLQGMATRHRQVFGTDLTYDQTQELLEKHLQSGTPIAELWADEYKVDDELAKQQEAGIQTRIDAAKKEAFDEALAKMVNVPGSLEMPEPISPVLKHSRAEQIKKAGGQQPEPAGMSPSQRAALSFARGTHAQPGSPRYRSPDAAA